MVSRHIRKAIKQISLSIFEIGQRFGVNITPNHYYVPIADVNHLRKNQKHWAKASELLGIDTNIKEQASALEALVLPYQNEYAANTAYLDATASHYGPGYGPIEAQALHGFLRSVKPRTIIEVGSGVSTHCMLQATERAATDIVCIEPFPSAFLKASEVELHAQPVEAMDVEFFDRLQAGDFLFIDSSHAIRPGNDVLFLYLEVLPRLAPGVYVHIHDIYLPYQYSRNVLQTYMQWSETALLQALLTNNEKLKIVFSLSMLHYEMPDHLHRIFPSYRPQPASNGLVCGSDVPGHFPSSIFLVTG